METDAEFVERMEARWGVVKASDLSRLFALARRGAAMQTVGHLDNAETAALRAAMSLKINEKQFLAAVDREGHYECGAGKLADDPLPPPPAGETSDE